ncbi:MAG: hypothetical protein KAX49_04400 [Halanaerobiales bacterium]|nr:hypothetical protein [Halanaerobiales bacterium]
MKSELSIHLLSIADAEEIIGFRIGEEFNGSSLYCVGSSMVFINIFRNVKS